jgi:hypothetical protein
MAKKGKDRATASNAIESEYKKRAQDNLSLIEDATCVDGAVSTTDDDDDDENLDQDWTLEAPILEVVEEIIICKKNKVWVNITVQYEAQDSDEFDYSFDIEEVDKNEVPQEFQ